MSKPTKKRHRWTKHESAQARSLQASLTASVRRLIDYMAAIEALDAQLSKAATPHAKAFLVLASRLLALDFRGKARKSQKMSIDEVDGLIGELNTAGERWIAFLTTPPARQDVVKRAIERFRQRQERGSSKPAPCSPFKNLMNGRN